MKVTQEAQNLTLSDIGEFNLRDTLDCGQAFRWKVLPDGTFEGVARGKYLHIGESENKITLYNTSLDSFEETWRSYFDLDRDYEHIKQVLSEDITLNSAIDFAGGIKILRQEPWECLCSFIISQNNNIPRIKGIIERLCETFGEKTENGLFTFPSAEKLASLTLEDLAPLRSGFRAKYILDAARRVASGEVNLKEIADLNNDDARSQLMRIYGVGEKVADCVLLFSMGRIDVIPKDVWIKRVLSELYGGALPDFAKPYSGIAQQYLFHYARMTKLDFGE